MKRIPLFIPVLALGGLMASGSPVPGMPEEVAEVLEHYCFDCHDDASKKGGFNLEKFLDEGE